MKRTANEQNSLFAEPGHGTLKLLAYGVLAIALMVADHRGDYLDRVRGWIGIAATPLYLLIGMPAEIGQWMSEVAVTRQGLLDHNRELMEENLTLRSRQRDLDVLRAENERLRALLDATPRVQGDVAVSELVQVDLDPFRHQVVIDRGASSGTFVGQVLADANGVLGQIVDVGEFVSYAMLISDPSHALPVEINRTAARTIAYGTGSLEVLDLPNLPLSIDLEPGDLVVTSGLGGRFPRGIPVGRVIAVDRPRGAPMARATLAPAAALDRSREVLLIAADPSPDGMEPSASAELQ